ncbi:MAG: cation transporter [Gammaproteobacteria bacterium]|nr:cation transporter [Gammaproteobacteria bacterium]
MDINLADVTLHIDQTLRSDELERVEEAFRQHDGIVSVHINPEKRHLMLVEYNPDKIHSRDLIDILHSQGLQGELIGL